MKNARNLTLLGLFLLVLPVGLQAQTFTNAYGNWTYTNTGNGTCMITGYAGSGGAVVIPGTIGGLTVTVLGNGGEFGVFSENASLTSVVIPNSVLVLADGTFADCSSLNGVTIPNSVTSIGDGSSGEGVFQGCTSLTSITIPDTVTNLWSQTFFGCSALTNAIIGNGVTSIGDSAFFDCNSLASVTLGNQVASIGDSAFLQCYPLNGVTLPNSLVSIGDQAFFYCESMTNITFGTNLNSIGGWAFEQCYGFTSLTIPASVTSIGQAAFLSCVNLASVYFQGNAPSLAGSVFAFDNDLSLFYYSPGSSGWGATFYGLPAVLLNPPNPDGSLQVNNVPAGADWQVDGGLPQPGGATVLGLAVGDHTVSFGTVSGWTTPPSQVVSVAANLTTVVNAAYASQPPLQVSSTVLLAGVEGDDFSEPLSAANGQSPYTWALLSGALPPGLSLAASGVISGVPSATGNFNFTVQVTDAFAESASQSVSLTIQSPPPPPVPDGNYTAKENWTVTVHFGDGTAQTYSGAQSGTLAIYNDSYTQINETGAAIPANLNTIRTIYYDYGYSGYSIDGVYPYSAQAAGPAGYYAVIQLAFFIIKVSLGSQTDLPSPWPAQSSDFETTGSSLTGLSGAGTMVDENIGEEVPSYYVTEVDAASTSQLNLVGASAPKITKQPQSQIAQVGTNVVFSVASTGNPAVSYQWQQDGYALSDEGEFSGSASPTLTITGVGPADAGTYSVVVGNIEGSVISANATLSIGDFLTVHTNVPGWGSVTPNDNGQVLADGQPYTLTASPAKGFGFTDWTEGSGTVLTNGTTLKFVMAANLSLTANFADTTKPSVAITNMPAGLSVSNASFMVKGTASDNVAVSNVWYKLNTNAWQSANPGATWSNWMAAVTLTPGANSILAQAVDMSGNLSVVASNSVKYVVSGVLIVQTNPPGWGTISPSYNGAALQIGSPYTLTATAAAGFTFRTWTDGNGNWLTNGATLKFTMSSNLTLVASFADTTPPKVAITNVPAGLSVSNAAFVVKGTASDNVALSNVWYKLNTNAWQLASPGVTWSNWMESVTLTPGANSILAQAMDTSGNLSAVASNSVKYVVSGVLMVRTNVPRWGTISPSYNGAALQIGSTYTLTATAAAGFKFLNWSNNFGLVTNGAALHFQMETNLVLTASFADVMAPTLSLTSPSAGQRVSGGTFTVTGKAGDNAAVASVALQVNHAGWFAPTGLTNWSAAVGLTPGTNTVQAFAVDTSGNHSLTNSVVFDYVVTNQLGLFLSGLGTLSPNYSNTWLEVGRNYSITATPATGFVFTNWEVTNASGSIGWSTNKPTVQFMMAPNLMLTVKFVETTKPVVTITSPKAGQKVEVFGLTVAGTTTDNWQVTNVWLAVGTNGWLPAGSTNNYKNWASLGLVLAPGTNVIKVYAVNLGGNDSLTNSVTVVATNLTVMPSVLARSVEGASPAVVVTGTRLTAGGLTFQLQITGEASGVIEVSSNLADWAAVTNFAGTNTTINFTDPGVTNASQRFYRAVGP